MENWLPALPSLIAIGALWWKVTTTMATKQDIRDLRSELQADIRELRQMFISHINDRHGHGESKRNNPE